MSRRRARIKSKESQKSTVSPLVIGGVALAAVLLVVGLIILGNQSAGSASATEVDLSAYPTLGDEDAPVTMVEYSDFGCPHCQAFALEKFEDLKAQYVDTGQIKYVVHPFYLGNPQIGLAAEAAWCAHDQGRFFDYQHVLFQNQGQFTINQSTLVDIAASLGLDTDAFSSCLSDRVHQDDLEAARQAALRLGINSTPTFYVNNRRIEGNQSLGAFQQVIDQELSIVQ